MLSINLFICVPFSRKEAEIFTNNFHLEACGELRVIFGETADVEIPKSEASGSVNVEEINRDFVGVAT